MRSAVRHVADDHAAGLPARRAPLRCVPYAECPTPNADSSFLVRGPRLSAVHPMACRRPPPADVDWRKLARTLLGRRLLPTLGPRIVEISQGARQAARFDAVQQATEAGRRHGTFLQLASVRAVTALAEAGIRSAVLKGPLLGEAIYGDPGRRLSSDIDLLVPRDELRAAVEVLHGLGYGAPADHVDDNGLPLLHFVLPHGSRDLPTLELHWRIHWYESRFASEPRLLLSDLDHHANWRPAPADELAALLLLCQGMASLAFSLGKRPRSHGCDTYGGGLAPSAIPDLLQGPCVRACDSAAVSAAERTVGVPASGDGRRAISGPKTAHGRTACHHAEPANQRVAGIRCMGFIDGLLMLRPGTCAAS